MLGFGRPGWDSQRGEGCVAYEVQRRAPRGSLCSCLWGTGRDTATAQPSHAACWDIPQGQLMHPRIARAAAVRVHAVSILYLVYESHNTLGTGTCL